MAFFVLNSDITIGKFRFRGVYEVSIKRSLYSIADTATIKIPSYSRIIANGKAADGAVISGKQFNDGDPVTIELGYNAETRTEFRGFVKQRSLNMPLEITCEGYSWLLRRNTIKQFWKTIKIKDLLEAAVSGIDANYKISIECEVDYELSNVNASNDSGFDLINKIFDYTDGCLSCFFIEPDVLWCGLVYTPYSKGGNLFKKGQVEYRLGYNTIKENNLHQRFTEDDPTQVKYSKKASSGEQFSEVSGSFKKFVHTRNRLLNQVKEASVLKELANEKAFQLNYSGYEGTISTFLQPFAAPGLDAYITDARYPENNGIYLIESTETLFGINGARRTIEIGPKAGFANDL
jgi:hypothetical protein